MTDPAPSRKPAWREAEACEAGRQSNKHRQCRVEHEVGLCCLRPSPVLSRCRIGHESGLVFTASGAWIFGVKALVVGTVLFIVGFVSACGGHHAASTSSNTPHRASGSNPAPIGVCMAFLISMSIGRGPTITRPSALATEMPPSTGCGQLHPVQPHGGEGHDSGERVSG
jgi:hypothetical protein